MNFTGTRVWEGECEFCRKKIVLDVEMERQQTHMYLSVSCSFCLMNERLLLKIKGDDPLGMSCGVRGFVAFPGSGELKKTLSRQMSPKFGAAKTGAGGAASCRDVASPYETQTQPAGERERKVGSQKECRIVANKTREERTR